MEFLQQIFELCIIPLLAVTTTYTIKLIKKRNIELDAAIDNELAEKYIDMLAETISECVIATNQTYVENLKNKNAFDKEAQEEAFKMTYNAIMAILSEEAKNYLTSVYGDLNAYIVTKIEADVNSFKGGVSA